MNNIPCIDSVPGSFGNGRPDVEFLANEVEIIVLFKVYVNKYLSNKNQNLTFLMKGLKAPSIDHLAQRFSVALLPTNNSAPRPKKI